METSIIIRTKNEEKLLDEVLSRLMNQSYRDFEIIIVDSGSTDRTLEIVKKYPVKLFQIKPEEFTYPYACNYGCKKASATKYFVFLSGHSLPISNSWLKDGINDFTDDKILGVWGPVRALLDATFWEKLFFNGRLQDMARKIKPKAIVKSGGMGVLGFTNAIIRRDLWELHNLDEAYGAGGEDGEWVRFWLSKGYYSIKDLNFSVYHSHGLGLIALAKQFIHWMLISKPHPYKKLKYRT